MKEKETLKARGFRIPDWLWECMKDEGKRNRKRTPSKIVREALLRRYKQRGTGK